MSALAGWEPLKGKWIPWKDSDEMEQRLSAFLGQPAHVDSDHEAMTVAGWTPLIDISEDEREYLIKAELPEIKKEDVKLTVRNQVLCISGERKCEQEARKKYHRRERAYGRFIRSFTLPNDIDSTRVSTEHKDGILAIHVPKIEKAIQTFIDVKAA